MTNGAEIEEIDERRITKDHTIQSRRDVGGAVAVTPAHVLSLALPRSLFQMSVLLAQQEWVPQASLLVLNR